MCRMEKISIDTSSFEDVRRDALADVAKAAA